MRRYGAVHQGDEHEAATGHERAGVVWVSQAQALLDLAGDRIDCREIALIALGRLVPAARALEPAFGLAALGKLAVVGDILAGRHRRDVHQLSLLAVRGRPEIVAAGAVRA